MSYNNVFLGVNKTLAHAMAMGLQQTGPEPTVRPVRFWPDYFLLGAYPLLVNAWD